MSVALRTEAFGCVGLVMKYHLSQFLTHFLNLGKGRVTAQAVAYQYLGESMYVSCKKIKFEQRPLIRFTAVFCRNAEYTVKTADALC